MLFSVCIIKHRTKSHDSGGVVFYRFSVFVSFFTAHSIIGLSASRQSIKFSRRNFPTCMLFPRTKFVDFCVKRKPGSHSRFHPRCFFSLLSLQFFVHVLSCEVINVGCLVLVTKLVLLPKPITKTTSHWWRFVCTQNV